MKSGSYSMSVFSLERGTYLHTHQEEKLSAKAKSKGLHLMHIHEHTGK
jgi:hypothetical protein